MSTNKLNTFYIIAIFSILVSCNKKPDYPTAPQISFISFNKGELIQSDKNQDSIFLNLSFTDGDGDLGEEPDSAIENVFITDNRTGFLYGKYKLPAIPKEGANNGVSGTIQMKLFSTCCIFPDLIPPCTSPEEHPSNTISFDVYIIDRSGNESNVITTSNIELLCE